ncbi:TetR/AcrR family transcriptional regulator [Maribacter thermophilus]|uniref:TetR/AcrR family transcriptional regulator n=1 Tax=Maribacter thermophilus TaxID=1197874 RepID=UPI0006415A48|nr:TetR/AcrR family transcriptional regulator [Maribacter thermophilus]
MKTKIKEKATDMFLNYGFKSVTMDDIANAIGISKKTIYSSYTNKTALIEDCVMNKICTINNGIDSLIALGKNPIEELYDIKRYVMSHLKDEKTSPQFQLMKYYPKIHENMKSMQLNKMQKCLVSNVERGIEQEIYRPNLNPEFIARIYFSGINSIKDQKLFPIERFPISTLMDDFLEYHLRGIVTEKGEDILNRIINSIQQ